MRRWFTRLLLALLLLVLLPALTLIGVLGSERGTRWVLVEALSRSADEFSLGALRGDLLSSVEIEGLGWRAGDISLDLRSARLAWRPASLLAGLLHIEQLRVQGLHVVMPAPPPASPAVAETTGGPPSLPALPVRVRIDSVQIEDVVSEQGERIVRLDKAMLATRIEGTRVLLETLSASAPTWQVTASGEVDGVAPYPFSVQLEWRATVPDLGATEGSGEFSGDMRRVSFKHRLTSPFETRLEGALDLDGLATRGHVEATWKALRVPVGNDTWRSAAGSLRLDGGADDFTLKLDADASGPGVALDSAALSVTGSVQPQAPHALNLAFAWQTVLGAEPAVVAGTTLAGGGSIGGDLERLRIDHTLSAPFHVATGADIGLAATPVTLVVDGNWRDLRWPLTGDSEYRSDTGEYHVNGDLDRIDFRVGAALAALGADLRDGRLDAEGSTALAPPFVFDTRVDWRVSLPQNIPAAGAGRFHGDMNAIDIEHALRQPFALATRGRVQPASDDALLDIEGEWDDARWPLAGDAISISSGHGSYRAHGGLARLVTTVKATLAGDAVPLTDAALNADATLSLEDGLRYDARLDWQGVLADGVAVRAEGSARGDLARVDFEHRLQAPFALATRGSAQLDGAAPRLQVEGDWSALGWPLTGGETQYRSERGQYTFNGTPDDYRVTMNADLDGIDLPAAHASLQASGSSTGIDIAPLALEGLEGLARLSGRVEWSPALVFDLTLEGNDINPGAQWRDWPGKLAFALAGRGRVTDSGPQVTVSSLRMDGKLRGYPLTIEGNADIAGSNVSVPKLELRSADNRLRLNGNVGDALDINFDLNAPNLSAFWPGLEGKATARGVVTGALATPRVDVTLDGRALGFEGNRVKSLTLDARVDVSGADGSTLEVRLDDALLAGQVVTRMTLSGSGDPGAHRATLEADTDLAKLALAIDGGWNGKRWLGRLAKLDLTPSGFGTWRLDEPAALQFSAQALRVDGLCVRQEAASVCAALRRNADDSLAGNFNIAALPLSLAKPWLPPGIAIEGSIDAEGSLSGKLAAPRARLLVTPSPGSLAWRVEGQPPLALAWRDFRIEAGFSDDVLQATANTTLDNLGQVSAKLRVGGADDRGDRRLGGRIDAGIDDIALVAAFSSRVANPKGRIALSADLGGSLARPTFSGEASLLDASVQLPDVGLDVTDIRLTARSRGDQALTIDGGLRSGGGALALAGEVTLDPAAGFPLTMSVKGENVEVSKLPIAHVYASPDLRLQHSAELTRLTGNVHVPRATFRLREVPPSATTVSDDEVVLQEAGKQKQAGARIATDLTLTLGKDVRFTGLGLAARFEGRLRVTAAPGQQPLGEGTIELHDAAYKAYGQDLNVERGRLLFAGPLDNPGLDIRAVRTVGEIKAGLEVSGTASRPSARVFSNPAMPDADAFSYLLTGRPLSSASASDGSMLGSAALALGVENADVLSKKIGRQLGLDEVGISGDGANAGLTLGKYLTPDLYVSYVMGLFDAQSAIRLDYRLTDRISIQGLTGSQKQAVDVLYHYEKE